MPGLKGGERLVLVGVGLIPDVGCPHTHYLRLVLGLVHREQATENDGQGPTYGRQAATGQAGRQGTLPP